MTRLVPHEASRPSIDHFGDSLVHDPYDTYNHPPQHAETSTIATSYTNGTQPIETVEAPGSVHPHGQTEAEALAAQYKSPSGPPPSSIYSDNTGANRMTYIDEEFNYYPSKPLPAIDDKQDASLVHNAADVGRSGSYQDLEYAEPYDNNAKAVAEKAPLAGFMAAGKYPLEQRIEDKKRGIGRQRYPFVGVSIICFLILLNLKTTSVWTLTVVMVCVFIYELVVQSKAQGTPVSLHPVVNPMLGPSSSALIRVSFVV